MRKLFAALRHGALALVLVFGLTACYHATVTSGQSTSGEQVVEPWAHGFVYGLVPPNTVDAASQCSNGVARVETYHSFVNGLAALLTLSLYTPMTIEVTCAGGGMDEDQAAASLQVPDGVDREALRQVLSHAARQSRKSEAPVYVKFGQLE